ncbi:MAG: amidohydrolase [Microscillaceae bacterium]|nr:amidohydrolase [Microscillaceae bacterium]
MNYIKLFFLSLLLLAEACSNPQQEVDLIVHHAIVYTVNADFAVAEAFAVKDGKIIEVGSSKALLAKYKSKQTLDAQGKAVYPGFEDAHCHFVGYGLALQQVDLVGTKSYQEILEKLVAFQKANPNIRWLQGRGWDQNDWDTKDFPDKAPLDSLFPDLPVYLTRVDGHAALVNQKALDLAGINTKTPSDAGGKIEIKNGKLSGILVDNAMRLVSSKIPAPNAEEIKKALLDAQKNCFALGLTSVQDAGLPQETLEAIDQLHQSGDLYIRIYAMISSTPENVDYYLKKGISRTDFLSIRSFKVYADGALGSRGACLLEPYSDSPTEIGFLRAKPEELDALIQKIAQKGFQVNTHCIGDSANRFILDTYAKYLKKDNDLRWRIEHAQVVSPEDIPKFGKYKILPSVQPTHATSDMYWADERLGAKRISTAYAFRKLYEQNRMIPLGSDFPVEFVNPLYGFHAAVARKDGKNYPDAGFQKENAVSREIALKGMTIWAAYAAFEEKTRGSIEPGKWADFVILEEDIMKVPEEKLRNVKVFQTYSGGMLKFNMTKQ